MANTPKLEPPNGRCYVCIKLHGKLLVDVANLATCCHDDYDVLLEVLGTLGKCYVSNPVAKTLDWKSWLAQLFLDVLLGLTLTGPKKTSKSTILQNRLNKENSWSMLPIWLLAAMMIMMYYWRFWEPWANAMLVVLLPKLWKLWLAQLFLDVFLGLTLTGPKKASKPTILHNGLNKEKTPGRCCQSGYMLPWWLWCTIGGFGNPEQMLC